MEEMCYRMRHRLVGRSAERRFSDQKLRKIFDPWKSIMKLQNGEI